MIICFALDTCHDAVVESNHMIEKSSIKEASSVHNAIASGRHIPVKGSHMAVANPYFLRANFILVLEKVQDGFVNYLLGDQWSLRSKRPCRCPLSVPDW